MSAEHTPTPWWIYANPMRDDGVFVGAGERKEEMVNYWPTPQPRTRAEIHICGAQVKPADGARLVACVNAFHSPTRTIATEQITEGLFWRMHDSLDAVYKAFNNRVHSNPALNALIDAGELLSRLKIEEKP